MHGVEITPFVRTISTVFAEELGLEIDILLGGRSRKQKYADARCALWVFLHDIQAWSYPRIGLMFHRDHSTVVKALRELEASPAKRERVRPLVEQVIRICGRLEADPSPAHSRFYRNQASTFYGKSALERSRQRVQILFGDCTHRISRGGQYYPLSEACLYSSATLTSS